MLTADVARKYLQFDPDTGEFIRVGYPIGANCKRRIRVRFKGDKAKYGYLKVTLLGRKYQAHRLAWLLHYGQWPNKTIDHINRDRADNRLSNLRDVSQQANSMNKDQTRRGRGYTFIAKNRRWQAQASINGKNRYLGQFKTEAEARSAYLAAISE